MDGEGVKALASSGSESIADLVARGIGNIKENINVRRCSLLNASSASGQFLSTYSHTSGEKINT